ncbi:MAG: hypothetical protein ABSF80_04270 [Chitinispirillaceae bacterium]|jgi:hypothetical protein
MNKANIEKKRPALKIPRIEAKQKIETQIDKTKNIHNVSINENDDAHRWYEYTAELLKQIFTTDEITDEFTGRGSYYFGEDISVGHYLKTLKSIQDRIELFPEEFSGDQKLGSKINPIVIVEILANKFHSFCKQIRTRYNNRVTIDINDEYDVQDIMHALLRLYYDDIRPEEWTPSYAGSSSRMDFLLKNEKTVIEVKKTRKGLEKKELGEQLSIDIMKYKAHPDCKTLICFVYDPEERIVNPKGFETDLGKPINGMNVKVYISQK